MSEIRKKGASRKTADVAAGMNAERNALTVPVVDVNQIVKKQLGMVYLEAEDEALTAWVLALWDELRSTDEWLVPPCPQCAGSHTRLHMRVGPGRPLPRFICRDCGRMYTRMSDSPLKRLRHPHKTPGFIRLLSQPLSLNDAERRLRTDYPAVSNGLMRFRELIAKHDPEGVWLARVRLGLNYVEMQLARDPGVTAARRTRRAGRDAPELHAPESAVLVVAQDKARSKRLARSERTPEVHRLRLDQRAVADGRKV